MSRLSELRGLGFRIDFSGLGPNPARGLPYAPERAGLAPAVLQPLLSLRRRNMLSAMVRRSLSWPGLPAVLAGGGRAARRGWAQLMAEGQCVLGWGVALTITAIAPSPWRNG